MADPVSIGASMGLTAIGGLISGMGAKEAGDAQASAYRYKAGVALINKQQIIAFDVRAPIQTLKIDKTTAVVIPYQSIVTVAEGKLQTDSVLVALSEDGSDKWSIFDGTGHTTRSLKSLIPGYTTGLSVSPARSQLIRGE